MTRINATGMGIRPVPLADRPAKAVASTASAPHEVKNLVPDALARLRLEMTAMREALTSNTSCTAAGSDSLNAAAQSACLDQHSDLKPSSADSSGLNLAARQLLRGVRLCQPPSGQSSPQKLAVLAGAGFFGASTSVDDFNVAVNFIQDRTFPQNEVMAATGLALGQLPEMPVSDKLEIVMELVRSGARCSDALSFLGISRQPQIIVLESRILAELGMPLILEGKDCQEVKQILGINDGPALSAFHVDVLRVAGLPLLKDGLEPGKIMGKLKTHSEAPVSFIKYAREYECGREIVEYTYSPRQQATYIRSSMATDPQSWVGPGGLAA